MRQGATRYERAHNYVQSGHVTAAAVKTSCAWAVIDVPGVGHDGKLMSAAAAPIVPAAMHAARREQPCLRQGDPARLHHGHDWLREGSESRPTATQESGHEQIQQGAHREAGRGVRSTLPNRNEILMRRWPGPIWTSGRH
jgi:hypothetical protein